MNFYLPTFYAYADYDFRNDQALDMLEELFWETSYSGYNFYDYMALAKNEKNAISALPNEQKLDGEFRTSVLGLELSNQTFTAPLSKESLHMSNHFYDGHTGLIASLFNVKDPYLMLSNKKFSILHVTCHLSLKKAIHSINKEKLIEVIKIGHKHMQKIGFKNPKIGVCGLNPHSGENGLFGDEEIKYYIPAINILKKNGINVSLPISADIIFRDACDGKYDLIIANYHDQGHIPMKLLYFDQSVNVTLGVPIIRTSVDHGTAFDIAYKNKARSINMVAAILYAVRMCNIK